MTASTGSLVEPRRHLPQTTTTGIYFDEEMNYLGWVVDQAVVMTLIRLVDCLGPEGVSGETHELKKHDQIVHRLVRICGVYSHIFKRAGCLGGRHSGTRSQAAGRRRIH